MSKLRVLFNLRIIANDGCLFNDLSNAFDGQDGVEVEFGDLLWWHANHPREATAVVSPANSFGRMDGGVDLHIANTIGWDSVYRLQDRILQHNGAGELPVGEALSVRTCYPFVRHLIAAPTMRFPCQPYAPIKDHSDVYNATCAALKEAYNIQKIYADKITVLMPGMGTGTGRVPYDVAAKYMRQAWDDITHAHCIEVVEVKKHGSREM